ncbi:MAG: hypothetical protein KDA57_14800 [Planctomycetales bacterium]|nr:hypothetical protein [Planctomycetales bacterium]
MSFDKFTDRAREVIDFANEEASTLGSESVDTVHLLLGMLREGQGVAGKMLGEFKVEREAVLEAYENHRDASDVPLSEVESRCLSATELLGHNYAGTEHLILAVGGIADCRAAKVLADLGVSREELCSLVFTVIGHADDFAPWWAEQA